MLTEFKTIAIIGTGALAIYYGGRLQKAGHRVVFLARSNAATLRTCGISVKAPVDSFSLDTIAVEETPEAIGPVDLLIITIKATGNDQLARLIPPLVHPGTTVMNFQNGLGVDEVVAAVVGPERTVGGLCFVGVNRIGPGQASCAHAGHIVLGEMLGAPNARTEAIATLLRSAGVKIEIATSLLSARWHKLIWNVPFNGLSVTEGGMLSDEILRNPVRETRVRALMREVQAIAAAEGVVITDAFLEDNVNRTRSMPYKPSTMLDFLAGRPLELEPIWGEPLRRAQAKGVATPELAALYAQLKAVHKG